MAWAFATAGVDAPELFNAIASEVLPRLDNFSSRSLANAAWAFACVGSVSADHIALILD
eukprot:CAMPEP_0197391254 /NCGR_PEP_ID=MMETSP1165-20131217/2972_1 /TAXON_ID=284809 /ORGANISM="Chrysocystis fragilis, Strain CCMP3189" /LENGTH=58 /DNA_ID=CAMNT_0042916823 /DNA_START=8 /DNA_END=181 /DNA_ORIENTATION=+